MNFRVSRQFGKWFLPHQPEADLARLAAKARKVCKRVAIMARIQDRQLDWSSLDDVRATFNRLVQSSSAACDWLKANKPRNDETLAWFNFLACSVTYLEIARNSLPCPLQVLALCTRSAYELYLRAKKALSGEQALKQWLDEAASDNVFVLEAFVDLVGASSPLAGPLGQQIGDLKQIVARKGHEPLGRPLGTAELAKEFGLEREHKALFGLFSKLVHPSAFLVNGWQHSQDQTMATTLLVKLLDYADQLLQLVGSCAGIPQEVTSW